MLNMGTPLGTKWPSPFRKLLFPQEIQPGMVGYYMNNIPTLKRVNFSISADAQVPALKFGSLTWIKEG